MNAFMESGRVFTVQKWSDGSSDYLSITSDVLNQSPFEIRDGLGRTLGVQIFQYEMDEPTQMTRNVKCVYVGQPSVVPEDADLLVGKDEGMTLVVRPIVGLPS